MHAEALKLRFEIDRGSISNLWLCR